MDYDLVVCNDLNTFHVGVNCRLCVWIFQEMVNKFKNCDLKCLYFEVE